MKASILLGVVLTFVGTVLAGPLAATSTTPQKPDPVAIAPRRNGFSDLPSDVNTCKSMRFPLRISRLLLPQEGSCCLLPRPAHDLCQQAEQTADGHSSVILYSLCLYLTLNSPDNSQNPSNQIPDNIMASPETGATSNSIIYTAAEIYTAMQVSLFYISCLAHPYPPWS